MAASPSGDLGPALTLSGNLSSTEAGVGWPLRAAPGVTEECRRQEAVPNLAWTRASQGAPGGLVKVQAGASLVAQWLRIRLPMQGTQVRALVWEGPTCRGATRPVSHNY